ncbi:MAG: RrF2 family transcriptional regulator [Actinomycetes bacterium]
MRISARADYAVRATVELAAAPPDRATTAESVAMSQEIPHRFLDSILADLRRAGLVTSSRGSAGGYRLARPAAEISVADVVRATDGPLVSVRGARPPDLVYPGAAATLLPVWIALRANVRDVLEHVTLADLVAGDLPARVRELAEDPGAWQNP